MKILHAYCLNYNLGDHALGIGVKNLLRHYLDVDLIAETNLQGTIFSDYFISEVVNKKYELLVIGGGGIIHGAHWPAGWFWLIDIKDIRKIEIPFIVYGAGYNYFKGEKGIPIHGIEHLKETIRVSSHFSLRNDGSFDRFRDQTGIVLPEVPDPGFHVSLDTDYPRPIVEKYVLIQLANDKLAYRFGSEQTRMVVVESLRRIVKKLIRHYKIILAPHVFEDIELSLRVADGFKGCEIWNFGRYAFDHSKDAIAYYKHAEFVLAMRGHAQILPISFNVPVISLETQAKNRGLMERLGLLEYNIDVLDEELDVKCEALIERIENDGNRVRGYYATLNREIIEQTRKAFLQIAGKLKNRQTGL